ncbi:hypothetical protein WMY93_029830 [Mugilogobius chulae]|uniref:Uncharacterized protein n=1 Tax=Mugilogobius chulae TaxID=88201 RepID=A0AAW0MXR4_9GOBI
MYVSLLNVGAHIQQLASQQPHDEPFINDQQFWAKLCSSLEVPNNPTNRHRLKKAYINRLTNHDSGEDGQEMPESPPEGLNLPEEDNDHDSGEDGQEMPQSPPEGFNLPEEGKMQA